MSTGSEAITSDRKWKLVFDGLEAVARQSPNPVERTLHFGITFHAASKEAAEALAREAMADAQSPVMRKWHIEEVPDGRPAE